MERNLSIRRLLMPKDTNHHGAIFGGTILAEIDLAGAVEARRHTEYDVVTRYMNGIEFTRPVQVGDVVSFHTTLIKTGRTSLTIKVEIEASRDGQEAPVAVTATEVVYVTVERGEDGLLHKVPVKKGPPAVPPSFCRWLMTTGPEHESLRQAVAVSISEGFLLLGNSADAVLADMQDHNADPAAFPALEAAKADYEKFLKGVG